ncbi:hypothetical protein DERP_010586 [Dermatophagoides pteronyssinus]|uniref:Uncharacterized protein n=1 Tax=Dermatophagoides pteronyssinus TaxID=6956 RepID=A0ABQ8JFS4_DERPT|nr:hypothetical protein DERP_010586 [Dermatophagoides pteronyssinus]
MNDMYRYLQYGWLDQSTNDNNLQKKKVFWSNLDTKKNCLTSRVDIEIISAESFFCGTECGQRQNDYHHDYHGQQQQQNH